MLCGQRTVTSALPLGSRDTGTLRHAPRHAAVTPPSRRRHAAVTRVTASRSVAISALRASSSMQRVFDWADGPPRAPRSSPGPRLGTWEFREDFTPIGRGGGGDVTDAAPARDGESVLTSADPG